MSRRSRKKVDDLIAGALLLFLIIFISGRIFSAGWDEFYAKTEFLGESAERQSLSASGSASADKAASESSEPPPPVYGESAGDYEIPDAVSEDEGGPEYKNLDIHDIVYMQRAYPDVNFARSWDQEKEDWLITVTMPANGKGPDVRTRDFYWSGGSMLPRSELADAENYWPVLYSYPRELADPADMTEEEREEIRLFSSAENRKNGAGAPMFFFDFLYQSDSRAHIEEHIKRVSFLNHRANVHERMIEPLARVEKRIRALAAVDEEVSEFLNGIKSNDSYLWRVIAGTKRKSFHSLGIAVDILPKSQGGKHIFWSWAKERHPDDWMLIPLKDRWMPPRIVIKIFEDEGFIWGGKWSIYDNMHFEYHPELIEYNFKK